MIPVQAGFKTSVGGDNTDDRFQLDLRNGTVCFAKSKQNRFGNLCGCFHNHQVSFIHNGDKPGFALRQQLQQFVGTDMRWTVLEAIRDFGEQW